MTKMKFESEYNFIAFRKAEKWIEDHNYKYELKELDGIANGVIYKSKKEIGTIKGNMRLGPVIIELSTL